MSDPDFLKIEQGLLTWLAIALKQEVCVPYYGGKLLSVEKYGLSHSAILDRIDPVYNATANLSQWRAIFCIDNVDFTSATGSALELIKVFRNAD